VPGSPFATGSINSSSDVVDPSGRFLYESTSSGVSGSSQVSGYTINSATGSLTPIPGSPFPAGLFTWGLAIDRTGRFLYATNASSNNVSAYLVDSNTGSLSPVPGSPFAAGNFPQQPAIDPTGSFLYVVNINSNNVSGYNINPSTGTLTPILGSPFAGASGSQWMATASLTPPTQLTIQPSTGGNAGTATIQIFGSGFQIGATAKLTGLGADIVGTNTAVTNGSVITTTFDLTGAAPGVRTVVITNPDNTSVTLPAGFTVEQGGAPNIHVDIIGRDNLRFATPQTYYLAITNSGPVDSPPGILSLSIPSGVEYTQINGTDLFVAGSTYDPEYGLPVPNGAAGSAALVSTTTSGGNQNLLFATPGAPSGATKFAPVQLTLPLGTSASFIATAIWQQNITNLSLDDVLALEGIPFLSLPISCTQCSNQYVAQLQAWHNASQAYLALQTAKDSLDLARINLPIAIGKTVAQAALVGSLGLPALGGVALGALISLADRCASNYGGASDQTCLGDLRANATLGGEGIRDYLASNKNIPKPLQDALGGLSVLFDSLIAAIDAYGDISQAMGAEQAAFGAFMQSLGPYRLARAAYQACTLQPANVATCGGTPQPPPPTVPGTTSVTIQGVSSLDPNDKVGSHGAGTSRFISGQSTTSYSIYFDNQPTATAPAQAVTITDTLDTNLDLTTLTLGPITFPNQVVSPPSIPLSISSFTTTVDLRPTKTLLVRINASVNISTGVLTWGFQSLDPVTGLPPTDPLAGFLPPGAEGNVFFIVRPKSIVTTGTVIQNTATIVFDVNPPINTPTWSNAIDKTKPVSKVSPLPATQTLYSFQVQWSGTDVGAGIQDFTIYVSDNGGAFAPALINTTATQGIYTGVGGHTYGFYSIARDLVGNVENGKTLAEATTRVIVDTTPPVIVPQISGTSGNNGWYRSNVTVSWSVTDPESGIVSSSGCNTTNLTADTAGVTLTCSATNGAGLSSSVPVTIKIDKTPPVISGMPAPSCTLWPVNGKLVQVATVTATDALSGIAPGSFKVTGTSNEPSAPNNPQIVITPNGSGGFVVRLQAHRLGTGTGRVYTLTATAADLAGNQATATATCTVPHDQGN
jgi:Lactonase, 7-bladed beta-propeller